MTDKATAELGSVSGSSGMEGYWRSGLSKKNFTVRLG
jgi:hypothetical protein